MAITETPQHLADASSAPRRPFWTRASGAQILVVVVGIVAFVANLAVLRSADSPVRVAVAATDLATGTRLDPSDHVEWIEVGADERAVASLVTGADVAALSGMVFVSALGEGDLISERDLAPASQVEPSRAFSIPVRIEHAVGGALVPGDRIDVIEIRDGAARYVATDVEVIAVPDGDRRGAFSSAGAFYVTVAVDDVQALEIAGSLAAGELRIVRSTGTDPVDPGSAAVEPGGS